jgi:hypothetical protein
MVAILEKMKRRHLLPGLCLAAAFSSFAASVELPITPNTLDQSHYTFSVSDTTTNDQIAFHITITAKTDVIPSDSEAHLSIVTHTTNGGGYTVSIAAAKPAIPVTLKKDKRVWAADFTVSRKTLKIPGLCCVFTEYAHTTQNGKIIAMPSATFYEFKLQDFLKP